MFCDVWNTRKPKRCVIPGALHAGGSGGAAGELENSHMKKETVLCSLPDGRISWKMKRISAVWGNSRLAFSSSGETRTWIVTSSQVSLKDQREKGTANKTLSKQLSKNNVHTASLSQTLHEHICIKSVDLLQIDKENIYNNLYISVNGKRKWTLVSSICCDRLVYP